MLILRILGLMVIGAILGSISGLFWGSINALKSTQPEVHGIIWLVITVMAIVGVIYMNGLEEDPPGSELQDTDWIDHDWNL
ncbi:hypothetical protein [Marinoscillum sp.]|uniref:hypothetical protein n=1 Tax=Marinoscillum sp. TaxID=2024838 RepID=UPI003BAC89AD